MGDLSHPEAREIERVLRDVSVGIRSYGHESRLYTIVHNVSDEEEEHLSWHSEKLAIDL